MAFNVQGGGGACECPGVGVFFNFSEGGCPRGVLVNVLKAEGDDVTRAQCPRGGGACECLHL